MNYILLDEKILETYGLNMESLYSEEKLKEWLKKTDDNGLMYYNLKDRLDGVIYDKIREDMYRYDKWFHTFIGSVIDESQYKILEEILYYFEDYIKPKTSIAKLKYSEIHDKIFMLSNTFNIPINKYISSRYMVKIQDDISDINDEILVDFNKNLKNLESIMEKSRIEVLFISNKTKYLNNRVYSFNADSYKQYIQIHREIYSEYTKLWSKLSGIERENRIRFYVYNNISIDESMIQYIVDCYNKKEILYNNIKWNKKYGEIDNINNIIDEKVQVKKKQIQTSLFETPSIDKSINENILYKLISNNNRITCDQILHYISEQFNTKINTNDSKIIKARYTIMKNIVEKCGFE